MLALCVKNAVCFVGISAVLADFSTSTAEKSASTTGFMPSGTFLWCGFEGVRVWQVGISKSGRFVKKVRNWRFFPPVFLRSVCRAVSLHRVFHSIRFKVIKVGIQRYPFFCACALLRARSGVLAKLKTEFLVRLFLCFVVSLHVQRGESAPPPYTYNYI